MGFFNNWPYTNFHELNLDWLLNQMKELDQAFDSFVVSNKLKYADPIEWDITKSYDPNTIVVHDNVAYVSVKPVPAGTSLSDTDYWLAAFDASNYNYLQDQINSMSLGVSLIADDLADHVKYPKDTFSNGYIVGFGDSNFDPNTAYGHPFEAICKYINSKGHKSYAVSNAAIQSGIDNQVVTQLLNANDYPANEVTLAFVMAGINDFHYGTYDDGAFGLACKELAMAIHAKFPNALIVAMMDGGHQLPNARMLRYMEVMRRNFQITGESGHKGLFISLADFCLQNSLWENQNHYNNTGANAIAARVVGKLFGGVAGYTPAPKRTRTGYTSGSPALNGAYDFGVDTITTIDPENLIRRDHIRIYTTTTFNKGTDPTHGIVDVPGFYSPKYIQWSGSYDTGTGYVPVIMLRSTGSYINVATLSNVTPNQAGDGGHDEPTIRVALPYHADETWTNARGYLEFDTVICWGDTQGGN